MEIINRLINQFRMKPHPEGGYYSPAFRSTELLSKENLPERYDGSRNMYSSIYFMVTAASYSHFHQLKTDEIWHFYSGDPITLHLINEEGRYHFFKLSNELGKESFQFLVKKNIWMAAITNGIYSFMGCTLAPGFETNDFELGSRDQLISVFPHLEEIIKSYT